MNSKLPFVFSNFAMTADGKIAFANGEFTPFSSRRDREHMMELRATADVVMCGARTIEVTRTILGNGGEKFRKLRLKRGLTEYPLRIIVSGSGSISPSAKIFQKRFSPIVILTTARISKEKLKNLRAVTDEVKICGKTEINFRSAFRWLGVKWNVRHLLCEGGGELHGALIHAGLVDEVHITICPKIFGGRDTPTIADGLGTNVLKNASGFRRKSIRLINGESFTIWTKLRSRG